jgi:hypothetical protein
MLLGRFLFDLDERAATQLPSMPPDLQSKRGYASGVPCWLLRQRDHSASGSGRRQSFSGGKTFSGGRPSASRLMMRWRSRMTSPPGITSARRSPEGPWCTLLTAWRIQQRRGFKARPQASQAVRPTSGEWSCPSFPDMRSARSAQTIHASAISSKAARWAGRSFAIRRHSSAYRRNLMGSSGIGNCSLSTRPRDSANVSRQPDVPALRA